MDPRLETFFDDQLDRIEQRLLRVEVRHQRRCKRRRTANRPILQDMEATMLIGSIETTSHTGQRCPTLEELDRETHGTVGGGIWRTDLPVNFRRSK